MSPPVYSHDQTAARVLVVALAFIVGMIAGVSFNGLLGRWAALPPECNGVVLRAS
jgi:predicted ABC-type sugar transport system permease subunit